MMAIMITEEFWRPVICAPGYSVSNTGRIRRDLPGQGAVAGKVLTPIVTGKGYTSIDFSICNKRMRAQVHRVVATAFLGSQPLGKPVVDHLNFKRADNRAVNLEWVSYAENNARVRRAGRYAPNPVRGEQHPRSKLTEGDVRQILRLYGRESQRAIARRFGISKTVIRLIHQRKSWAHVDPPGDWPQEFPAVEDAPASQGDLFE